MRTMPQRIGARRLALRTTLGLVCSGLLATLPAHAAPKKSDLPWLHERLGRYWMLLAPIEASLDTGFASGWDNRGEGGALLEGQLSIEPQLRWRKGRFRARLPLSVEHRATFGFDLPETALDGALALSWKASDDVELELRGGVARAWRIDWPDLYQPVLDASSEPTGAHLPTDRYSSSGARAALSLDWRPSNAFGLGLRASFDGRNQDQDPLFDPILAPNHLVPLDRARWQLALDLETEPIDKTLHLDLRLAAEGYDYDYAFARDAGTGATHAAVGGTEANPLQSLLRVSARPEASLWLRDLRTRLSLDLHLVHQEDRFEDYYTWNAAGGRLGVRVRPVGALDGLTVELGYTLDLRRYTSRGYQPGPTHAALDEGSVRTRDSQRLEAEVSYSLWEDQLEPFMSFEWRGVEDTMPDYEPWVNPPGSPYAVDWDQDWYVLRIGLRLEL